MQSHLSVGTVCSRYTGQQYVHKLEKKLREEKAKGKEGKTKLMIIKNTCIESCVVTYPPDFPRLRQVDQGRVPHEQGHVTHQLVFPGEGRAARALPLQIAAVLLMSPQIGQHGELLPVAPLAHVHLRAVAPLVVILGADHRLERLELGVLLVPPAALVRARVLSWHIHRTLLAIHTARTVVPAAVL